MSLSARVATGVTPKTGDSLTQDFTVTGFGTPAAAIVKWSRSTSSEIYTDVAEIGFGIKASGQNSERAVAVYSADAANPTNTEREIFTQRLLTSAEPGNAASATGTFIKDGLRLTFSGFYSDNYAVNVLLLKGVRKSDTARHQMSGTSHEENDLNFRPNFIFTIGTGQASFGQSSAQAILTIGAAHQEGPNTIRQFCCAMADDDAETVATITNALHRSDSFTTRILGNVITYRGVVTEFIYGGYRWTTTASTNNWLASLCLKLDDPKDISLGTHFTPAAPGTVNYPVKTKNPQALFFLGSIADAEALQQTDANLLGYTAGMADNTGTLCSVGVTSGDNIIPSDTASIHSTTRILVPKGNKTTQTLIDNATFGKGKYALNFSSVDATPRLFSTIAFGSNPPPSGTKKRATFNDKKNMQANMEKSRQEWNDVDSRSGDIADSTRTVEFKQRGTVRPKRD